MSEAKPVAKLVQAENFVTFSLLDLPILAPFDEVLLVSQRDHDRIVAEMQKRIEKLEAALNLVHESAKAYQVAENSKLVVGKFVWLELPRVSEKIKAVVRDEK